ncbi:MAG: MarR family winged helix-turn-helix transcriptional regulator [Gaiellaceae bacterium]
MSKSAGKTFTSRTLTEEIDPVAVADALRPALLRIGRELRREARTVGATPEQVTLLVAIKTAPGIGVRELAASERVSAPAMSNSVDRLERDGLVTRTQSTDDRRRVGLTLTDEGQRLLRRVRSRRTAWLAARLRQLSSSELAAVEAAIEPLTRLLHEGAER